MPVRIRQRKRQRSRNGLRAAGCCCVSPARDSPSRAIIYCRCDCAVAAARSVAHCLGKSLQSSHRFPPTARPISAKEVGSTMASPRHPPGFYGVADSRRALNLSDGITELKPIVDLPDGVARESFAKSAEIDIRPPLLLAAFLLGLLDLIIAYALRGLLRRRPVGVAAGLLLALMIAAPTAHADDSFVVKATSELRLAYIQTGNQTVDTESRAGLVGLIDTLNRRTAVETAEPLAVDIERDELIFFPLLYWPVTAQQPAPSPRAAERINRYLETGGTILFDTRDAGEDTPGPFGNAAASQTRLRQLVAGVNIVMYVLTGNYKTDQVHVPAILERLGQ